MITAYLDIETASAPEVLLAGLREAPAGTDPVGWVQEHAAKHATNPITGRVVCWAVATSADEEVCRTLADFDGNERAFLGALVPLLLDASTVVAHNGRDFDFPFLRARALACEVMSLARLLNPAVKPWESWLIDTTDASWCPRPTRPTKGWSYSLDTLADLLGVKREPTTPGANIPAAWYAGRVEEVRAHCLDDVRTLRAVTRILADGRGGVE